MSIKFAYSLAIAALVLSSCSDDAELPESDEVTETRMDEVDIIDGTISDDMTDVDTATSEEPEATAEDGSEEAAEEDAE